MMWLEDFRNIQFQQFLANGFPTRKNELWKYTEISEKSLPTQMGAMREEIELVSSDISPVRLVFINGHFAENLSTVETLPKEVIIGSISQMLQSAENRIKPYLLREFDSKRIPFAKLNSAKMMDGLYLEIPDHITITTPIHLLFLNTEQNAFITHPRNMIVVGEQSKVTLIEEHAAKNAEHYVTNVVTEIHAKENACVDYYKMQNEHATAMHIANVLIDQQQNSCVKTFSFSNGGRLAREDLTIHQQAPQAEIFSYGLYALRQDDQHVDHHVHVDHLASHGNSFMLYKGILDKKSRAVFNGKVHVHPATRHIQAHQANHHLLLSNEAEVNAKPELEIYAEDVKCTHGATIGQIDQDAIFYLLSRGMEKNAARALLIRAFAEAVYSKIEDKTIRQFIQERMGHHDE